MSSKDELGNEVELTGRELDAAVAERVMEWHEDVDYDYSPPQINWVNTEGGFERVRDDPRNPENVNHLSGWSPSSSIADAMEVVERLSPQHSGTFSVAIHSTASGWLVEFWKDGACISAEAETLPEAICRAALSAFQKE